MTYFGSYTVVWFTLILVPHMCVSELYKHWFSNGLALCHWLNQCWFIDNWILRNKFQWNRNTKVSIHENAFEYVGCEMAAILSRGRWVNTLVSYATVYPKKYAHGFVVLCFVVVMQSFIMNSHEVFIHIHQGCFAGTGAIVRLPQCQWSKPDGYGKISQCITTTRHSKAKTVCILTFWR